MHRRGTAELTEDRATRATVIDIDNQPVIREEVPMSTYLPFELRRRGMLTAALATGIGASMVGPRPSRAAHETSGAILKAEDFGAAGDGRTDDTSSLQRLLVAMQQQGRAGELGGERAGSRYLVEAGALEWTTGGQQFDPPPGPIGPTLYTRGRVTLVVKEGSPNAPILSIHNDPMNDPSTGLRYVHSGYVGPIIFEDTTRDKAINRHGVELFGVQYMTFAPMFSNALKGDLFHIRKMGNAVTGDYWHVFANVFEGASTWNTDGWTFNNDSLSQYFNGNIIGSLWNIEGAKGIFRGPGACNTLRFASTASCRGYALDLTVDQGSIQAFVCNGAELDAPEKGVRLSGVQLSELTGIRVTHRKIGAATWPRSSLDLTEISSGQHVSDNHIQIQHRIDASVGEDAELGTMCSMSNSPNINRNHIEQTYFSAFEPDNARFKTDINSNALGNLILLAGKIIHDDRITNFARATTRPGQIAKSDFGARGSIVRFDQVIRDQGDNYEPGLCGYRVPYAALYRVNTSLRLVVPRDTQIHLAVMSTSRDGRSTVPVAEMVGSSVGAAATYATSCQEHLAEGSLVWISCVHLGKGTAVLEPGILAAANNFLEVGPVT